MPGKQQRFKNPELIELSMMLKALAHPSRIAIMYLISNSKKKLTVKCIYNELKMSQPVISRHLGILKNCGLLERSTDDGHTYYTVRTENKTAKQIVDCFARKK